jgi:hypothetical protein
MTKSLLPWSLKGVSLEARARAKTAAGEAGEPLGKWLGDTIRQIAEAEATKVAHGSAAAPPDLAAPGPGTATDPDALVPEALPAESATRVAVAEGRASAPDESDTAPAGDGLSSPNAPSLPATPDGASPPQAPAAGVADEEPPVSSVPDDWRTAFVELTRRLDETERRTAAAVAPLQVAVERLATRLDRDQPRPRRGWRVPRFFRFTSGR